MLFYLYYLISPTELAFHKLSVVFYGGLTGQALVVKTISLSNCIPFIWIYGLMSAAQCNLELECLD